MITSEKPSDRADEIVKNGRVFKPVYKHLLDKMPQDLVQEMARRRLEEIEQIMAKQELNKDQGA